jgi:hypothetical protein
MNVNILNADQKKANATKNRLKNAMEKKKAILAIAKNRNKIRIEPE